MYLRQNDVEITSPQPDCILIEQMSQRPDHSTILTYYNDKPTQILIHILILRFHSPLTETFPCKRIYTIYSLLYISLCKYLYCNFDQLPLQKYHTMTKLHCEDPPLWTQWNLQCAGNELRKRTTLILNQSSCCLSLKSFLGTSVFFCNVNFSDVYELQHSFCSII